MAQIDFYYKADADFSLMGAGSGLGYYGDGGFAASVAVGEWQGRTYVTDGNGVIQGPEANNVKWLNAQSGILGQAGTGIGLLAIPNQQATVNMRFTHASAVKTQNIRVYIYDRVNKYNPASGVTTKLAQVCHPNPVQVADGSGSAQWMTFSTATPSSYMLASPSPGLSGLSIGDGSGSIATSTRHDWYFAMSASPDSIGSKSQYGLYVSLEYL